MNIVLSVDELVHELNNVKSVNSLLKEFNGLGYVFKNVTTAGNDFALYLEKKGVKAQVVDKPKKIHHQTKKALERRQKKEEVEITDVVNIPKTEKKSKAVVEEELEKKNALWREKASLLLDAAAELLASERDGLAAAKLFSMLGYTTYGDKVLLDHFKSALSRDDRFVHNGGHARNSRWLLTDREVFCLEEDCKRSAEIQGLCRECYAERVSAAMSYKPNERIPKDPVTGKTFKYKAVSRRG